MCESNFTVSAACVRESLDGGARSPTHPAVSGVNRVSAADS